MINWIFFSIPRDMHFRHRIQRISFLKCLMFILLLRHSAGNIQTQFPFISSTKYELDTKIRDESRLRITNNGIIGSEKNHQRSETLSQRTGASLRQTPVSKADPVVMRQKAEGRDNTVESEARKLESVGNYLITVIQKEAGGARKHSNVGQPEGDLPPLHVDDGRRSGLADAGKQEVHDRHTLTGLSSGKGKRLEFPDYVLMPGGKVKKRNSGKMEKNGIENIHQLSSYGTKVENSKHSVEEKQQKDENKQIRSSSNVQTTNTHLENGNVYDSIPPIQPHQHRIPRGAPERHSENPNNKNIRARMEGHVIIGALFPLHQAPTQKTAFTRQCGEIREFYGIQRVEAFLMTLQNINNDNSILPKINLGWDIRDSCWYSAIALENSIDFIKDAIAGQSQSNKSDDESSEEENDPADRYGNLTTDHNVTLANQYSIEDSVQSSMLPSSSSKSNQSQASQTVSSGNKEVSNCKTEKRMKPIAGLVGPGSSEATIQVQNLLQIFNIPQIGYSATSIDLSDKSHYKYFLRVVPPDRHQAQALVDVVVTFNWTYISTVHSDGNYGVRGMEKFVDLATEKGVCIATSDNVASSAEDEDFDKVLDNLMKVPNATVVVCFCEGMTVKKLLLATQRRGLDGRFLIVGSDGWGNRLDVVQGHELAALGALSIKLYSPPVPDFGAHYTKLRPDQQRKNPWFPMFWQQKFKCSLDPNKSDLRGFSKFCSGNESLSGSDQDSKLGFVVNAVETMARALHNMHEDLCPGVEGLCPAMDPIKGSVYLDYLLNVSFKSYSGEMVHFDASGDPPGRYEILNYQKIIAADGNVSYDYVTIGHWKTGTLKLNGRPVHFPRLYSGQVKSVCSEPCSWGQAKKVKDVACCWICTTCLDNEILIENNTGCRPCNLGYWPNANKTDCDEIVIDFISWQDTEAIVCVTVGCIGILATIWVAAIFVRFHDTPVVKASTRELSYIILAGIALAFSSNFFIVAKPDQGFCYLTRILPGLSFSLIYGALVTKTNRIARILEGSKRISTKKPRFMSATAQVVITAIIIGIECAVIAATLIYQPANSKLDYPTPRMVRLVCDTSTMGIIVPLGFDLVLIILCTIYAVKTRNLPENFNEAKFIGFTMYATCIIWSGFFPIFFAGENKEVTLSFSVSLSAAIALLLLFFPKVYVVVWVPEKNTRGAFTTSRDVRCHIGSKSLASGDSIDIKESSTFENLFKADKGNTKQWKQKSLDEKRLRFVMQHSSRSDSPSSYVNHGVIRKHALLESCGAMIKESRDSARTDSTHLSGTSSSEKDRIYPGGGDVVRQFLSSDYHLSPKQTNVRPDSPAEKEKHRIHKIDNFPENGLVGASIRSSHQIPHSSTFRKSLSSNCVSMDHKTRSIQCQTEDELLQSLLPVLRRRCLSKGKHILERSIAMDATGQESDSSTSSCVFKSSSSNPEGFRENGGCPDHPDSPSCHCPIDLSDLAPLVLADCETISSRYKKPSKTKDANPSFELSRICHSKSSHGNKSQLGNTCSIHASSKLHCCVNHCIKCRDGICIAPPPDGKISPSNTSSSSFSDNICSVGTIVSRHENSSNSFKFKTISDHDSSSCHNSHPNHHCCFRHHHHHHHHHHHQNNHNMPNPTSNASIRTQSCSPLTNKSISLSSSSHYEDSDTLRDLFDQRSSSPCLYQRVDSSDSHTTLSTESSSFTLPPFNTSTDSNRSNHSLFSETSGNVAEQERTTNILGENKSNHSLFSETSESLTEGERTKTMIGDNKDDDNDSVDIVDTSTNTIVNELTPLNIHCEDGDCDNVLYSNKVIPLSPHEDGEDADFQHYLQARGVNFEFSSQCSDL